MRLVTTLFLLILTVTACTNVRVGQHVAASDYAGSPKRIFIVNRMDASFSESLPGEFAAAAEQMFANCNVAVLVYRPEAMELNAEAKVKAAILNFRPDSTLTIQQTLQLRTNGDVNRGEYLVTLHDLPLHRDVWRGAISASATSYAVAGGFLADRSKVGGIVADQLIRTMAGDNIIKTCPPFPPERGS